MNEVAFHFGAPDKIAYTCRLLRKAVAAGARVTVLAQDATQARLDADLWGVSPVDFVAHCREGAGATLEEMSPVVLAEGAQAGTGSGRVLVNLLDHVPEQVQGFSRIIEVVGTDEPDRVLARQRWKHYVQAGYQLVRHDLAAKGGLA